MAPTTTTTAGVKCRLTQERQWSVFGRDGISQLRESTSDGAFSSTFAAHPMVAFDT